MRFPDEYGSMNTYPVFLLNSEVFTEMPVCSSSFILFALLYRGWHLKGNVGSEVPSQVWWGSLEGQLLLSVITVRFQFSFLRNSKVSEPLPHPRCCCKPEFWNIRTKMQSPKAQLSPSFSNQTWTKCICATVHMASHRHAASLAAWLSPSWTDTMTGNFRAIRLQGCSNRGPGSVFFFFWEIKFLKHL